MFNLRFNFLKNIKNFIFPFYRDKDLKYIFKILQDGIPENKIAARFVGGCVRKYLSNQKIDDIDVATILTTDQVKQKFQDTNLKVIDTGLKHGTVTLVSDQHKVEIGACSTVPPGWRILGKVIMTTVPWSTKMESKATGFLEEE